MTRGLGAKAADVGFGRSDRLCKSFSGRLGARKVGRGGGSWEAGQSRAGEGDICSVGRERY